MNDTTNDNFESLLEGFLPENIFNNELKIIDSVVVAIEKNWIIVDAGLKSQHSITKSDFLDAEGKVSVEVGDVIKVYIESLDDGFGETRLSREKAKQKETWIRLSKAMEEKENITGKVLYKMRGGYHVDIDGLRSFLPGSLTDISRFTNELDSGEIEGKVIEFRVLQMDEDKNNILISRQAVFEREMKEEKEKLLERIYEGAIVSGVVKSMVSYGAFVGLNGIDGLLHITDMSWHRIKRPEDAVTVGQKIDVKVLKFDQENSKISLGMKQITDDPWTSVGNEFKAGDVTTAKIMNIVQYGCFAEIAPGVEGLIHLSEMSWVNKNIKPSRVVDLDQEVEVKILEIDPEKKRLSLSIKRCALNPWEDFANTYAVGGKVAVSVNAVTDFGIFVRLEGTEVDGLLHVSDLDWGFSGKEMLQKYKKGDILNVVILNINAEDERISLGLKQMLEDPFIKFCDENPLKTKISGKIKLIKHNKVIIKINEFVSVDVAISKQNSSISSELKVGEDIDVVVSRIDKENRNMTAVFENEPVVIEREENLEPKKVTTIGDLIKEQMDSAKKK